jgi:uncharacterized protein
MEYDPRKFALTMNCERNAMASQGQTKLSVRFAPFAGLAASLLPHAMSMDDDPAHDASHLCRVWSLAMRIAAKDGGDPEILAAAVLLHDCVKIPKASPGGERASLLAGAKAGRLLANQDWKPNRIAAVVHAIEAHSFSAGIKPETIEAMILQDADRLDAIGAIGVARCFIVAGRLGRPIYDLYDPTGGGRDLDDATWTLDHFATKLLKLRGSFLTREGLRIGRVRHNRLRQTYEDLLDEIGTIRFD